MFDNQDFYPTPPEVVELMIAPIRKQIVMPSFNNRSSTEAWVESKKHFKPTIILEPSCGDARMLDYFYHVAAGIEHQYGKMPIEVDSNRQGGYEISKKNEEYESALKNAKKTHKGYCIESDPNLLAITESKGYRVIEHDFFEFDEPILFDLILMNPPFSCGDKHLLKAWNTLTEGKIICLLNRQTIDNPFSSTRQLLKKIIEKHGEVEYIGNAFSDADRKTDVETAIIRLEKKKRGDMFDAFEGVDKTAFDKEQNFVFNEENFSNKVARVDVIESLVDAKAGLDSAFVDFIKAAKRLQFYSQPFGINALKEAFNIIEAEKEDNRRYNSFLEFSTSSAWKKVMSDVKFKEIMTSKVRGNFENFCNQQGQMGFTKNNIEQVFDMLWMNKDQILQDNVLEVFDIMTKFHKENQDHTEGWATNDLFQVNRKVILPDYISIGKLNKQWTEKFGFGYNGKCKDLDDIDRAMCHLKGKKLSSIVERDGKKVDIGILSIKQALQKKFDQIGGIYQGDEIDGKCQSEFFDITFWKKCTMHIYFREEWLYQEFNRRAMNGKGWLKPEGAKQYSQTKSKSK